MEHPDDIRHKASMIASRPHDHQPDVTADEVLWMTDVISELCDELERRPAP